jgi:hypothetical protein
MARRRTNLSERIKAKRQASSRPPESAPPASAPILHVAPLPPPPIIETPNAQEAPRALAEQAHDAAPPASVPPSSAPPASAPRASEVDRSAPPVVEDHGPISVPGLPSTHHRWPLLVAVVAIAAGVAIGVKITRVRAASRLAAKPPATQVQAAAPPPVAPPPPPPAPVETAAPIASAAPTAAASASAAPSGSASAGEAYEGPSATTLRDHALVLLEQAKNPEAMAAARAAMAADPRDAMPYLVLGSALQDLGYWKQAHETYALCVKNAKKGMIDECRAMLRQR